MRGGLCGVEPTSSGTNKESQPAAIRPAVASGQVRGDDPDIPGIWAFNDPMPAPRWVNGVQKLYDAELQILQDIIANARLCKESECSQSRFEMLQYSNDELLGFIASGYRAQVQAALL